jgi:spermidine/putrescine transport system permease protein
MIMWSVYLLMFAPLCTVVVYSFLAPVADGGYELTTRYYKDLFANAAIGEALGRSLVVAAGVAVIAGGIGALGAFAIDRGRLPGFGLLRMLSLLPLVMPELVLGLASLLWFVTLRMTLGLHSMILAHVTFTVSYVVVTVRGRLQDFDRTLEDAAADLGCGFWRTLFLVTLPNVWPAVVAGMMMAFVLSFDDFLISFFNAGVGSDTLPLKLYSMIRFGLSREMYALSSLLVLITVAGVAVVRLAGRRRGRISI